MRKFYINNSNGEGRPLNNERMELISYPGHYYSVFLQGPTGMGFALQNTYSEVSDGFFTRTKRNQDTSNIIANLYFCGSTLDDIYRGYQEFVDWLMASPTATLVYSPHSNINYYCDVDVGYINKNEVDKTGVLICPCSFYCRTPWYSPLTIEIPMGVEISGEMKYPFTYNDELVYASSASEAHTIVVNPKGHIEQGVLISYSGGEIVNPSISLVGEDTQTLYSQMRLMATIPSEESFVYSSRPNDSFIQKIGSESTTDMLNYVDPTSEPFGRIPLTEPVSVRLRADNNFEGEAHAVIFSYYRSV